MSSTPAAASAVGSRSIVSATRFDRESGRIRPGQRAHIGTRSPPSYSVPLPSRMSPFRAPTLTCPPLSLVKITSVSRSSPVSASVFSTRPMPSSMCSINATSFARLSVMSFSRCLTFAVHSVGGWIGVCGAL